MNVLRSLLFSSVCFGVHATNVEEPSKHAINGFLSQGTTWTSENSYIQDNGGWSTDQTYFGLNGSYRFSDEWRVAGQAVYIDGGNRMEQGLRIDFAFIEYNFSPSLDDQYRVYLGRYKHKFGLNRLSRDVPSAQPSIYLPQSVYQDVYRDMTLNTDGVSLDGFNSFGEIDMEWQINGGITNYGDEVHKQVISLDAKGEYKEEEVYQYALYFHLDEWSLGSAGLISKTKYRPRDADGVLLAPIDTTELAPTAGRYGPFFRGKGDVTQTIWSARYRDYDQEFLFEFINTNITIEGLYHPTFDESTHGGGGYAQYRRYINDEWEWFARLDATFVDFDDKNGNDFSSNTGLPAHFRYQKTASLGTGWSPGNNWMLRTEYHYVEGTSTLQTVSPASAHLNPEKYWHMFTVQLSYWW